jgi:hypothetical protein
MCDSVLGNDLHDLRDEAEHHRLLALALALGRAQACAIASTRSRAALVPRIPQAANCRR